jgi:hypothetical protein
MARYASIDSYQLPMLLVTGGLNHKTLYHGDQQQEYRANNIAEA